MIPSEKSIRCQLISGGDKQKKALISECFCGKRFAVWTGLYKAFMVSRLCFNSKTFEKTVFYKITKNNLALYREL